MRGTSFCPPSSTDPVRMTSLTALQTRTENGLSPKLLSYLDFLLTSSLICWSTYCLHVFHRHAQTTHKHTHWISSLPDLQVTIWACLLGKWQHGLVHRTNVTSVWLSKLPQAPHIKDVTCFKIHRSCAVDFSAKHNVSCIKTRLVLFWLQMSH